MQLKLQKIVGGGQTIATMTDGRKAFIWGGLPNETAKIQITKKKSKYVEAIVTEVISASPERVAPRDSDSYLSTSPWQIVDFDAEQNYKLQLIREAFRLHQIELPQNLEIYSNDIDYGYRNKVEFSWYGDKSSDYDGSTTNKVQETLDLAFFRRGSKGKIVVDGTSLARTEINKLARQIRDLLRTKPITARNLKTLVIRCNQQGSAVWQLYTKDRLPNLITAEEAIKLPAQGGEIIYSNPKSPASVITEKIKSFGDTTLTDTILGTPFNYACEGFFQVNIPVYEQALRDIKKWVYTSPRKSHHGTSDPEGSAFPAEASQERKLDQLAASRPEGADGGIMAKQNEILDLYSGVGTIGLTIGSGDTTLVEINEHAVREMNRNIKALGKNARAVLAPSEKALDYIRPDQIVIVDPPRAGLHADVIAKLLETLPPRIIYLSCNPVTQARDTQILLAKYHIVHTKAYNFFPRTPHIENLIILERQQNA